MAAEGLEPGIPDTVPREGGRWCGSGSDPAQTDEGQASAPELREVEMIGNVFVLAPHEQRPFKLEVLSYDAPEQRQAVRDAGMVPTPSGAGHVRVRWAFLDSSRYRECLRRRCYAECS